MDSRLFAAIAAAVGITLSGGVAARPLACSNYATVAAWAAAGSCIDNLDGDLLLTYVSSTGTFPSTAAFSVAEIEVGGVDLYDISFNFGAWTGGGSIQYRITSLDEEVINGANFDLITMGTGALATKTLLDIGGVIPFLTLTSIDGSRDPAQGEAPFASRLDLLATDTFALSRTALYFNADNSFRAIPISEPGTAALLVLGLTGLAVKRRRASS